MAKPVKKGPLAHAIKLVRKKTAHGTELRRLEGGLGAFPDTGLEAGKMGMRVARTLDGIVRFSLMREGADGKLYACAWADLAEDDVPHLMRVLMM